MCSAAIILLPALYQQSQSPSATQRALKHFTVAVPLLCDCCLSSHTTMNGRQCYGYLFYNDILQYCLVTETQSNISVWNLKAWKGIFCRNRKDLIYISLLLLKCWNKSWCRTHGDGFISSKPTSKVVRDVIELRVGHAYMDIFFLPDHCNPSQNPKHIQFTVL